VKQLVSEGKVRLATLVSQMPFNRGLRVHISNQIAEWKRTGQYVRFQVHIKKIYELIAGDEEYVFRIFDWERAFPILIWYLRDPAVKHYELFNYFNEKVMTNIANRNLQLFPISNSYTTQDIDQVIKIDSKEDLKKYMNINYNLIGLACENKNYSSWVDVLSARSYSPDSFESRLLWLIVTSVSGILRSKESYSFLSEASRETNRDSLPETQYKIEIKLYCEFADELEMLGMWEWSIYILLLLDERLVSLEDKEARIQEVLNRNCIDPLSIKKLDFLTKEFLLPLRMVYKAQAMLFEHQKKYEKATNYYILAKEYNSAHQLFWSKLVRFILGDKDIKVKDDVSRIISKLEKNKQSIQKWFLRSEIISNYYTLLDDLKKVYRFLSYTKAKRN